MPLRTHKELKPQDKVGFLYLIEPVYKMSGNRKRKYWKCYCSRCGNYCTIREDNFYDKRNRKPSCGCARKWWRHHYLEFKEK